MPSPAVVLSADPAAGIESSTTVPAGETWRLLSAQVSLVTSAAVANRRPALVLDDGTNEVWRIRTGVDQAASLTRRYIFAESNDAEVDRVTTFAELYVPLAEGLLLSAGFRIRTVTQAIDAGDNYGVMNLYVVKFVGNERVEV